MKHLLLIVFFFSGCLGKPISPKLAIEAKESTSPVVHIVKSTKENLTDLAKWYTGDSLNAIAIAKYNGKKNVAKLQLGESILIPEFLVKTRKMYVVKDVSVNSQNQNKTSTKIKTRENATQSRSKESTIKIDKEAPGQETQTPNVDTETISNSHESSHVPPVPQEKSDLSQDERKLDELRYKYLQELNDK